MDNQDNTFRVGLCMAGAISAGAYTAGVMDYLIEALEEWEKRRASGDSNVPSHKVEIPVTGGASAGGMTSVIFASAIRESINPVREVFKDENDNLLKPKVSNKFYHSWVDLISDDMLKVLLDTSDIKNGELESVLNADFIEKIADRAIEASDEKIHRTYIAEQLKVFTTLVNLKGMDFNVVFNSDSSKDSTYIITNHSDFACFKLAESEADYSNDGWIPLNFNKKINTRIVKDAAIATGAFPVGLKARTVTRDAKYMNDLNWFDYITKDAKMPFPTTKPYTTVNVDGGTVNNEPFENVRNILTDITKQDSIEDYQSFDKFKSTVLMIDPFPSQTVDFNSSTELKSVIGNTLGALIDQSRIKSSTLIDTKGSNRAGQFLIAPVRYDTKNDERIEGEKAIACGSLGGFGGFVSKEFRIHDYFLGRGNCEKFLRDYFTVPLHTTNEIFVNGYANVKDKTPYITINDKGEKRLQIIPIFTESTKRMYMPTFVNNQKWPTVKVNYLQSYKSQIKKRIEKVILNFATYTSLQKVLLWVGCRVIINGKIANSILDMMTESFKKHKLLD
ncbi:patatin-like phospholipase family protein [Arcicella lustrica]|uniref:Patatin-like phospholipase family protein n=1 Tax=Arcicella lustrica TaxID=2984196 RepID=A0ABU5SPH8_9BACT|nr:patatin-like phospholipase family protein [Arcicella sp. DC25W]MEA5429215.1 patatin-like phospholipase family protein [Arcicella sp. DC25W]